MPLDKWEEYLQLEGGTSPEKKKIFAETENVSVLTPVFANKHNHCKYLYRIMYVSVILSYFIYVESYADIISTRTSIETLIKKYLSLADPDLQIRGVGGVGHLDPEKKGGGGGGGLQNNFFRSFGSPFGLKIRRGGGEGGPPGPLPCPPL